MTLGNFTDLQASLTSSNAVHLAVAGGNDDDVLKAVFRALDIGLIVGATISGDVTRMQAVMPEKWRDQIALVPAGDAVEIAKIAVNLVRVGAAHILMKGSVDSTSYLKAVVDKETGIRQGILSNVTVASMPSYHKFLAVTDNGIIPNPDMNQKRQIILNTRGLFSGLGISPVKVAVIAATEKTSKAIPATLDAAQLSQEARTGGFDGFEVDGPFGYDVAVSTASAQKKGLGHSGVAGDADLILCPNIDAANALAKSLKLHGQAETGSIVLGAKVPVLLNSRSDGIERRLNALMLAIAASHSAPAKVV